MKKRNYTHVQALLPLSLIHISWDMDGNDAYYTGTSDKTPPVSAVISYKLDGEEISPQELAGKSGRVEITIALQNNLSRQATVDGAVSYTHLSPPPSSRGRGAFSLLLYRPPPPFGK